MNLESLQQQYAQTLQEYKSVTAEYIAELNADESSIPARNFVSVAGYSFQGSGIAGQSDAKSPDDCVVSCNDTTSCAGATFVSNQCILQTGDNSSPVIPTTDASTYAIVPKRRQLLLTMSQLNDQLASLNRQIDAATQPSEDPQTMQAEKEKLEAEFQHLMKEKAEMQTMLQATETLHQANADTGQKVSRAYYIYLILLVLVCILCWIMSTDMFSTTTFEHIQDYSMTMGNMTTTVVILVLTVICVFFVYRYAPQNVTM